MVEFRPVDHDPRINVKAEPPLWEFAKLLGGAVVLVAVGYVVLGLLVDVVVERISPEREIALWNVLVSEEGGKTWREAGEADALPARYRERLKRVFARIPENVFRELPPYDFQVRVIKNDAVNAAALPGGRILVFSGLMDAIESDDSLLFVIGHELGHFAGKDHLRSMGRTLVFTVVAVFFLGTDDVVSELGQGIESFLGLKKSRDQETAADDWGLRILTAAAGSAEGAVEFFDTLAKARRLGGHSTSRLAGFLSTHPYPEDRARRIQERAKPPAR